MANPKSKKNENGVNSYKPNFWGMSRDVLIASLNKGQFPIAIVGAIVIILILKMPNDSAKELLFEILSLFKTLHLMGWGFSLVLSFGWYFSARHLRKIHTAEITRLSNEKKQLQLQSISKKALTSSNG